MNRLIAISAAVVAAVAIPSAAVAAPTTGGAAGGTTKVPLVNDCGNGSINGECLTLDMVGTFAGVVKFRHKANGDLRLMVVAKAAPAGHTYKLEIYCGHTPAAAGALVGELPDALKVDSAGVGTAGPFEVPAGDVRAACGTGNPIGHLQLVDIMGASILDAAPIKLAA